MPVFRAALRDGEEKELGCSTRGVAEIDFPICGRASTTLVRVVGHTRSDRRGWLTTVDLFPRTGRKHQLRAHLAGTGFPILGDDLYPDAASAVHYMQGPGSGNRDVAAPGAGEDAGEDAGDDATEDSAADEAVPVCKGTVLRKHGLFLQAARHFRDCLDHFSRIVQLCTTAHARCDVLCVVPMLIGC